MEIRPSSSTLPPRSIVTCLSDVPRLIAVSCLSDVPRRDRGIQKKIILNQKLLDAAIKSQQVGGDDSGGVQDDGSGALRSGKIKLVIASLVTN